MSSTYFVAALRCSVCGVVSANDTSTTMVSHLLDEPGMSVVSVGAQIPQSREEIAEAFYRLGPLPAYGPLVLLQEWYCNTCNAERFAHVVFDEDGRVVRIEAVPLTRSALDTAHLGSARFPEIYEGITGESLYVASDTRPDFVERLRAKLPDSD